jgi:hypothetical protein
MLAFQLEGGKIMIERGRLPAFRGVTLTAIRAKATFMSIIIEMTGIAVLQGHREIPQPTRI